MGAWGYYDDENDATLDCWGKIIDRYIKKYYPNIRQSDDYDKYYELMNKIIKRDKCEISKFIYKTIKPSEKKYVVGIAVRLVRLASGKKALPKKLFRGFSENLRKLVCKHIKMNIKKNGIVGWKSNEDRIKALLNEEKLFTCN
jgi:hypothetical protein